MNDELERIGQSETRAKTAGILIEIRTEHHPDLNPERYCYATPLVRNALRSVAVIVMRFLLKLGTSRLYQI
jgi:hypothetical protein